MSSASRTVDLKTISNFRINPVNQLGLEHRKFKDKVLQVAISEPSKYFKIRGECLEILLRNQVSAIYDLIYNVLTSGEVDGANIFAEFGKPNAYAKLSNRFFRKYSNEVITKGYFDSLNVSLRKMNSPFVLGTYLSMIFFTMLIGFIFSIFFFIFL